MLLLATDAPGAEEPIEVNQRHAVVALELVVVQPVEVAAGERHAVVPEKTRGLL